MPDYRRAHLPGGKVLHNRELLVRKAGGSLPYTNWIFPILKRPWASNKKAGTAGPTRFRVYKTVYDRDDALPGLPGTNNDHGTIMVVFADGTVAHLDNGWFARTGGFANDVLVYGNSNIPPNYTQSSRWEQ